MTFSTYETSIQDGAPIEAFEFIGSNNSYYLTSYAESFSLNGQNYVPVAIQRKDVKISTQEEDGLALEITLPYKHPLVQEYAYSFAPPDLSLNLYRVHLNSTFATDQALFWVGRVTSFSVSGQLAKLLVPTIFSYLMNGNTPTPRFQRPCNHRLYDSRCKIDPATHQTIVSVASVSDDVVQVSSQPFGPTELVSGEIIRQTTGEARMIIRQAGTSLTMSYPFSNIEIGDLVRIRKGCDHALGGDCVNRFDNAENFGGFSIVPPRNPFEGNL